MKLKSTTFTGGAWGGFTCVLSEFFPGGWRRCRGHVIGWCDILLVLVFSDILLIFDIPPRGLFTGLAMCECGGGGYAAMRVIGAGM